MEKYKKTQSPLAPYLEKFKKFSVTRESIHTSLSHYLAGTFNLDIPPEAIRISRGIIRIETDSVRRSEIHLHKREILDFISINFPNTAHDIR
jgi:hypothetical protein